MTRLHRLSKKRIAPPKPNRCAIYARCATQPALCSIAEQIRMCTEHAGKQGWKIAKELVQADVAVSGASVVGRHALTSLMATANKRPRPFDHLLIADVARLTRNSGDYMRIMNYFGVKGVDVVMISELKSLAPSAQTETLSELSAQSIVLQAGGRYANTGRRENRK